MSGITSFLPLVSTITAAAIAGVVAFVISVLTKEHKVSEFRQSWIDSVRNDVSELLAKFHLLEAAFDIEAGAAVDKSKALSDFWARHYSELVDIQTLVNRVVLKLNRKEHSGLIGKLGQLEKSLSKGHAVSLPIIDEIMIETSSVLKVEWERVKSGEYVFQALKRFSYWFAVVGLVVICISLVGYNLILYRVLFG